MKKVAEFDSAKIQTTENRRVNGNESWTVINEEIVQDVKLYEEEKDNETH